MKTAQCAVVTLLMGMAFFSHAMAGSGYGVDINSPSDDSAATTPQPAPQMSDQEIESRQKAQEQDAKDKDWLLRSYEEIQGKKSSNLYYQVSANKDLARLAGVIPIDADAAEEAKAVRTGVNNPGHGALSLRPEPVTGSSAQGPAPMTVFKPLITPMSMLDSMSGPKYTTTSVTGEVSERRVAKGTDSDDTTIETPGLTAAQQDPLFRKGAADLTFDLSSLDALPDSKTRGNGLAKDELPPATNQEKLLRQNAAALNMPTTVKTIVPSSINATKTELPEDLAPAKMIPQSPIRAPIADTHDIFFH